MDLSSSVKTIEIMRNDINVKCKDRTEIKRNVDEEGSDNLELYFLHVYVMNGIYNTILASNTGKIL